MEDRTEEFRDSEHAVRPEDVASPEATVEALYDVISGPPNTERDWEHLRSLFDPRARIVIGRWIDESGEAKDQVCEWDLEGFIEEGRKHWLETGFWEDPVMRGVNSVQLLRHSRHWWIVGIVWDIETAENPLRADLEE